MSVQQGMYNLSTLNTDLTRPTCAFMSLCDLPMVTDDSYSLVSSRINIDDEYDQWYTVWILTVQDHHSQYD